MNNFGAGYVAVRKAMLLGTVGVSLLAAAAAGAQQGSSGAPSDTNDALFSGFQSPGEAARPRVWWHWMNGNVSEDGIQKDMEWMKRVGIAGLQAFDAGMATPQVVDERLPYMTDGWKRAFAKAASLADSMDMELGIAASPGWSETGGPWVTPADAMKKMAWSATHIRGGRTFDGPLASPPTTTGVFQTSTAGGLISGWRSKDTPPQLYTDAKVLAFRVPADFVLPTPKISVSGGDLNANALSDGDLMGSAIKLPAAKELGGISWIRYDYGRPVTIRGVTLSTALVDQVYNGLEAMGRSGLPPLRFRIEASDDGQIWRDTGALLATGIPQRTSSVPNVTARFFRFVSERLAANTKPAPGRFVRPPQPTPEEIELRELVLTGAGTVDSFEEKAGYYNNTRYFELAMGTPGSSGAVKRGDVIDISDRMDSSGRLRWTPPKGDWMVLRIGSTLTGAQNSPASPEATGLEVDKLNRGAVKRYMDHYLGMYRDASKGLIGKRGLKAIMFDSWEAGNSNWTPEILADFKRLRGYDATPWLPVLAGFQVESAQRSDAFLWDWRRTLQQLLVANHYELLTDLLHSQDLIRYGEAHEELFVTPGDGMEMKQSADIPMGAMWQVDEPGAIENPYFTDLQESASVAHIYGQNIAASESLTGGRRFGSSPWDLKSTADAIMAAGANRFVIHTSTHQPGDRGPGMTLGVGQYFTRLETWAEQAKPWVDYLSRSSYMLQQGVAVSDVAVFYGEAGPAIASYRTIQPAVPAGYRFDFVNSDVIRNRLSVKDGFLTTATGMRYGAILFGKGTQRVTLPVLEKVRDLVAEGATLVGLRPQGSPSLADDPDKVKAILDQLWSGAPVTTVGKGRVFAADDTAAPLATIGLDPDFRYAKPRPDSNVLFVHRRLASGDVYFLNNRTDRQETIEASFRVEGRMPELWDAATGTSRPAAYRIAGGRTEVTVPLDRRGSVFVVFRNPATATSAEPQMAEPAPVASVTGPWLVNFEPGRGAPASATFQELTDWKDNADPGIRYFSGAATYSRSITTPKGWAKGQKLWLDLGEVRELAEVRVNGALVGTLWKPPFRVDIGAQAKRGANRIEIKVVNLWVNRLIGDVQPGVTQKITFTAADGKPAPGRSLAEYQFTGSMPYRADAPLRPSGLLGPVTLLK